jgi:sarcosine oxidase/L-pipecolate oxidase
MDLTVEENDRARSLRAKYEKLVGLGRTDVEWLEDGEAIKRRAPHLQKADIAVSGSFLYCSL